MYDPLAYPLLHVYGESGWQFNMYPKRNKETLLKLQMVNERISNFNELNVENLDFINEANIDDDEPLTSNKFVTVREFYAYRLHDRPSIVFFLFIKIPNL